MLQDVKHYAGMNLLHYLQTMERPTLLNQDEFKIEVRSFSEEGIERSTTSTSSSTFSSEATSDFSFCPAQVQPAHLRVRCAYADEIFLNGIIRPLRSNPFQAVTLGACLPRVETVTVYEAPQPCTSSSSTTPSHIHPPPPHTSLSHFYTSSEQAHAIPYNHHSSLTHTPHYHSHRSSPSHTHGSADVVARATPHHHTSLTHAHRHYPRHTSTFERAHVTTHPHDHASHPLSTSIDSAHVRRHATVAAKWRRALCLLSLRRVCHANEDESTCPPGGDPYTSGPVAYKKTKSATYLKRLLCFRSASSSQNDHHYKLLVCQSIPKKDRKPLCKEPPINTPPRSNQIVDAPSSPPSPYAIHYHAQRAHKERMKNRTLLPYRPGLLSCICY